MNDVSFKSKQALSEEVSYEDVIEAFDCERFNLVYQPVVSLIDTNVVVQVEALLRFNHPDFGELSPVLFLPLIEKTPLMRRLTEYVVKQAIKDIYLWREKDCFISVALNIPYYLFQDYTFVEWLNCHAGDATQLVIEIAYNSNMEDSDELGEVLSSLQTKGWQFTLSNIEEQLPNEKLLQNLSFSVLKLSRQVVSRLAHQIPPRNVAKYLCAIAQKNGVQCCAVGIETEKELQVTTNLGFDFGQGFHIKEPVASDELIDWVCQQGATKAIEEVWGKPQVLILENSASYQKIYADTLGELFEVYITQNETDLLDLLQTINPEVIIISDDDLMSSDVKRVEQLIQKSEKFKLASLLIVSQTDSVHKKLTAFEVGALDFLVKPLSVKELIAKICRITVIQKERDELKSDLASANEFAKLSTSEASMYGGIVNFYRSILHCQDEKSLANRLFEYLDRKQLRCSIEFRYEKNCMYFEQTGPTCSPAEIKVYEVLKDKGRLYSFGQRMMINYANTACLIKNMPSDNENCGVARDYLAILIEGIDVRYQDIIRQRTIQTVLNRLKSLTDGLTQAVKIELADKKELMANLELELQMSFHALDLTEEQENQLIQIIESMLSKKEDSEVSTLDIIDSIEKIILQLNKTTQSVESSAQSAQENSEMNEVELF